jgi:hypothetical protein
MKARQKNEELARMFEARGIVVSRWGDAPGLTLAEINELRRAQMTLHRWGELECGTDHSHIERDETTGRPFLVNAFGWMHDNQWVQRRTPTADREAGALRRIKAICDARGLHFFHQTDPRGVSLYIAAEPLTQENYSSRGIAVYVND